MERPTHEAARDEIVARLPVLALFVGLYAFLLVYLLVLWVLGAAVPTQAERDACLGPDPVPTLSHLIGCFPAVLAGYVVWVAFFLVFSWVLFVPQVMGPLMDPARPHYHLYHDGALVLVAAAMIVKFLGLFLIAVFPSVTPTDPSPASRHDHYIFASMAFGAIVLESALLFWRRAVTRSPMWRRAHWLLALNAAWVLGEIGVGVALARDVIGPLEVTLTVMAAADRAFQIYDYHADVWEIMYRRARGYTNKETPLLSQTPATLPNDD